MAQTLSDFIGKKVLVTIRDSDDIVGKLLSVDNGGYVIQDDDDSKIFYFIPEANNVISITHDPSA